MMDELNIKLTRNEIAVLRQLIHVAVQARGMEVAEAAVVLSKKFNAVLESFDLLQQRQTLFNDRIVESSKHNITGEQHDGSA